MAIKVRLNKFISESGVCSRREADKYIEEGHVFVNGKRAKIGDQVSVHDKVMLNGNKIEPKKGTDFTFIAFNKPVGIISTTEIGVKDSIIDYIGYHERIFPIGRLDKESQGLIFLTNNGDIVNKILRAGNNHEKEYLVTVNKAITDEFIMKMGNGVPILGEMTKKCTVTKESTFSFRIILIQGLNRQIRRMCEYFDYEVVKLERTRIMNISLKGIPLGEWRPLETAEIEDIMKAIATSSSTSPKAATTKTEKQAPATKKPESRKKTISGGSKPPPSRATLADRMANPNPKSKELRGPASNSGGKNSSFGRSHKSSSSGTSHRGNRPTGKR